MAGTRDAVLDAAERVIRAHGAARATTKLIAKEAGYSEATLYKHFSDKHELFLNVLTRQMPEFGRLMGGLDRRAGTAPVRTVLEEIARTAIDFYSRAVPLGTSLFSETRLLEDYRSRLTEWGSARTCRSRTSPPTSQPSGTGAGSARGPTPAPRPRCSWGPASSRRSSRT
ncbi:TetR/AcrR family transcriptional regulator [Nocardiopsis composta]